MPRRSPAEKDLEWGIKQLKAELNDNTLSKARRRSLLREYNKAALSLSKLRQLELRNRLQDRKPLSPVMATQDREPKNWLEQRMEELGDVSGAMNVLGGSVDDPQPPNTATVSQTPAEVTTDDQGDEGESSEGDSEEEPDPAPEDPIKSKPEIRDPEPEKGTEDWLANSLKTDLRHERAAQIRAELLDLPGMVPPDYSPRSGEGRFSFSDDPAPKKTTGFYDPFCDESLGKGHEF